MTQKTNSPLVSEVLRLAQAAHCGQRDKLGVDDLEHVKAVARAVSPLGETCEIVGLLHDSVEFGDGAVAGVINVSTRPRDISTRPRDISTKPRDIFTRPRDIPTKPGDISTRPRVYGEGVEVHISNRRRCSSRARHEALVPGDK